MNDTGGSMVDEVARLMATFQQRVVRGVAGVAGEVAGSAAGSASDVWHRATHEIATGPECRLCPICQMINLMRSAGPEVFEHLMEAGEALAAAAREVLAAYERSAPPRSPGHPERRGDGGVEHIDIG